LFQHVQEHGLKPTVGFFLGLNIAHYDAAESTLLVSLGINTELAVTKLRFKAGVEIPRRKTN
jgi:hypothetical protein